MKKAILKTVLSGMITFTTCILIAAIFYFFNGSLEVSPTPEQQEKVRIATAAVALICVIVDIVLVRFLLAIGKRY